MTTNELCQLWTSLQESICNDQDEKCFQYLTYDFQGQYTSWQPFHTADWWHILSKNVQSLATCNHNKDYQQQTNHPVGKQKLITNNCNISWTHVLFHSVSQNRTLTSLSACTTCLASFQVDDREITLKYCIFSQIYIHQI